MTENVRKEFKEMKKLWKQAERKQQKDTSKQTKYNCIVYRCYTYIKMYLCIWQKRTQCLWQRIKPPYHPLYIDQCNTDSWKTTSCIMFVLDMELLYVAVRHNDI